MNRQYRKIFALLMTIALILGSIPASALSLPRMTVLADDESGAAGNSSGDATVVSDGKITLGIENVTANITPKQDVFEIYQQGKKVDGKNYKAVELAVSGLKTGEKSTKYVAGVVKVRSSLANITASSKTESDAPATAKYKGGKLTVTAKSGGGMLCLRRKL